MTRANWHFQEEAVGDDSWDAGPRAVASLQGCGVTHDTSPFYSITCFIRLFVSQKVDVPNV